MKKNADVIIIGGGLAGLTAALHLTKKGLNVTLIEKYSYPRHKVCGEYLSKEILPYLNWLNSDILQVYPTNINTLIFTHQNGKTAKADLPLGGLGISRYSLDNSLYLQALKMGCTVIKATVTKVTFNENAFTVMTENQILIAEIVLGAFGKRSNVDQVLKRNFMNKTAPWLAVKGHYSGEFHDDVVALHNFKDGYCGITKVEDNTINMCYLADLKSFKKHKNITEFEQNVLYKNKHIKYFFENSTLLFDKPLTISQISFDKKPIIENHILMIGDTAGVIHPLCGNGMAMAMHSAKISSELIVDYYTGKIVSRKLLEKKFTQQWKQNFEKRLLIGNLLSKALQHQTITTVLIRIATMFPSLLPLIIKQTHGKAITIK
ncbi:NAD(P)/FAD-dependent oxidoreductase [Sphingobacterium kitahiroshimense]|uniref:NAD(P)/FAD-dependent oxidoreductase n=1 Tax=Sphingobacterium sp. B16(2022) TaxID=2914044 RepID=UPI00143C950A|nr:NAD(P)/FAD-dependent oxidoreductase [Sphingobacterium sp. B16(2022)]NJI73005.1 NAD(P)/FAD-dependent oxidoreductase [Sphingobacterium sp. B16(2022)]